MLHLSPLWMTMEMRRAMAMQLLLTLLSPSMWLLLMHLPLLLMCSLLLLLLCVNRWQRNVCGIVATLLLLNLARIAPAMAALCAGCCKAVAVMAAIQRSMEASTQSAVAASCRLTPHTAAAQFEDWHDDVHWQRNLQKKSNEKFNYLPYAYILAEATYSPRSRGSKVCASCVAVKSLLARFDQELCMHR